MSECAIAHAMVAAAAALLEAEHSDELQLASSLQRVQGASSAEQAAVEFEADDGQAKG